MSKTNKEIMATYFGYPVPDDPSYKFESTCGVVLELMDAARRKAESDLAQSGPFSPMHWPFEVPRQQPYRCPVCEGRGTVESNFYSRATMSSTTDNETCRTCHGAGIIWG